MVVSLDFCRLQVGIVIGATDWLRGGKWWIKSAFGSIVRCSLWEVSESLIPQSPKSPKSSIEVYYPEEPGVAYPEYLAKGQTEEELVVKTLRLSTIEGKRVETLLQKEVIQSILADIPEEYGATFEYRPLSNQLILTAPLEIVLKIQTLIQDEKTFHYFVEKELDDKLVIAIISVVHPLFLEKDYPRAIQLATDNYKAVNKLLQSLDSDYRQADKDCWLNSEIGTITIVDEEQNIFAAYGYIDRLPYIPKDFIEPWSTMEKRPLMVSLHKP